MSDTPERRAAGIRAHHVDGEIVLYDGRTEVAHRLNPTSARIWDLIDGVRTTPDLAVSVGVDVAVVELALDQLSDAGLLEHGAARVTRRSALARLGKAAAVGALLPSIASIAAPLPAAAQSRGSISGSASPSSPSSPSSPAPPSPLPYQTGSGQGPGGWKPSAPSRRRRPAQGPPGSTKTRLELPTRPPEGQRLESTGSPTRRRPGSSREDLRRR